MSTGAALEEASRSSGRLAECGFFVLCLLVLAGTRPFEAGNIQDHALHSRGAAFEAALYLGATAFCIVASLPRLRPAAPSHPTFWAGLLMIYCGFSLSWSVSFQEAAARFAQYALVVVAILSVCAVMPASRALALFAAAAGVVMIADLSSVLTVTNAKHLHSDLTEDLTGAWKGVHIHKNYAGAVAALAAMTFALRACYFRRLVDVALAGVAVAVLVGSASRASMTLALLTVLLLVLLRGFQTVFGTRATRWILLYFAICLALTAHLVVAPVAGLLADGRALTGRAELWNAMAVYIQTHPLTGSGFASFWRVGDNSPILSLTRGWGIRAGQGHNGYLDALVTLGVPGFLLTMVAFVLSPLVVAMRAMCVGRFEYDLCFCLIVFSLMHNMAESSLFGGNHPVFFALVLGIAALTRFSEEYFGRFGE